MAYTIGDLVEHSVDRVPDRLVLVQGDRELSFRELEDRAKEAQKRYVPRSRMSLLSWTWTYHALFQSVCQCELWHEEVPGWLERLLEQPQVLAHHA